MRRFRALWVWLFVVLTFVTLSCYFAFWRPTGTELRWGEVGGVLGLLAAALTYNRWRLNEWFRHLGEGDALADEGRYEEAAKRYAEAQRFVIRPRECALSRFNQGVSLMQGGDFEGALAILGPLARSFGVGEVPRVAQGAPLCMALLHALRGDGPEAKAWLREAQQREQPPGALLLPEVVVLLREDNFRGAEALLARNATAVRASSQQLRKTLLVARAYVQANLGLGAHPEEGAVEQLALLPEDVSFLGARWPRMRDFLRAHGLLRRPAQPPKVQPAIGRRLWGDRGRPLGDYPLVVACAVLTVFPSPGARANELSSPPPSSTQSRLRREPPWVYARMRTSAAAATSLSDDSKGTSTPAQSSEVRKSAEALKGVTPDAGSSVGELVGEPLRELVPRVDLVRRLTTCARELRTHEWDSVSCLEHLMELDRPTAVEVAREWTQVELPPDAHGVAWALARFPSAGALEAYLDMLGLTDMISPELGAADGLPVSAEEALLNRGRASLFDKETGRFPNRHDELLRDLAALAPGVLDDFHFEEHPPSAEDDESGDGIYRLVAVGGGMQYEVRAEDYGDWYDVASVLGFLNSLARARGNETRWMLLATGDQMAVVVAGPRKALAALVVQKLVLVGHAGD